eukprot:13566222-Ditylum_brightwellii.AAC.1
MQVAFHSTNTNPMTSSNTPWHVPHLPATEGDSAASLAMMWDSVLGQNTQIIMEEWKQVVKNFKLHLPCHWQDATITV